MDGTKLTNKSIIFNTKTLSCSWSEYPFNGKNSIRIFVKIASSHHLNGMIRNFWRVYWGQVNIRLCCLKVPQLIQTGPYIHIQRMIKYWIVCGRTAYKIGIILYACYWNCVSNFLMIIEVSNIDNEVNPVIIKRLVTSPLGWSFLIMVYDWTDSSTERGVTYVMHELLSKIVAFSLCDGKNGYSSATNKTFLQQ